jgi:hypothetical protein
MYKNLNYSPQESPEYQRYTDEIEALAAQYVSL